ncbi:MAG TPA: tyrosine-type recombinase/integrase [Verrucomicrobiae bacterium]|nr:tyrosine-type recombinase/integrase [Verrucomicrobiae bacterium]
MNARYRLVYRGARGGMFYFVDKTTGKRESLHTTDKDKAQQVVEAKNQAERQPQINLQIAKAYLAATDSSFVKRTWREVMAEFVKTKTGTNRTRSDRAIMDKSFDSIRDLQLIETRSEHFLRVLQCGKVSTNNYLRRFHNFALDMGWLPWPVLPKRQWPAIHYKEKRAVTLEEHQRILAREKNTEMRAFLKCCWHIGGSQSDVAHLKAEDIDWKNQVISFFRSKTGTAQIINIGHALGDVLRDLPGQGILFPRLAGMDEKHRASLFQMTCRRLGITGISLHSYRYAWAERAKSCGYPERFAQEALGHNSVAVHRAYAKKAKVKLPSLEEFEQKVVPMIPTTVQAVGL